MSDIQFKAFEQEEFSTLRRSPLQSNAALDSARSAAAADWFALRVKTRRERMVADIIGYKGYDHLLPTYVARHQWSDRVKNTDCPLFPGYVFCRLNLQARAPLLTTPGVLYIVGNGRMPAPIPESEITAIQAAVRSGLQVQPCPYCNVGEDVVLNSGPLTGVQGILLQVRNQYRVVVSVNLLRRSMAVEVDRSWVVPISAASLCCLT